MKPVFNGIHTSNTEDIQLLTNPLNSVLSSFLPRYLMFVECILHLMVIVFPIKFKGLLILLFRLQILDNLIDRLKYCYKGLLEF